MPEASEKMEVQGTEELVTGKICCSIYTKTGIAIPDTANKHEDKTVEKHYHYPFMKTIDGHPMIPASSIRGVVRNV